MMGKIPTMRKKTWRDRIADLVKPKGKLEAKAVSLKAGLGATFVSDLINKGRTPSVENFVAVAEALGVSPLFLVYGDENPKIAIPVIGIVAAGEGWIAADDAGFDPIEFAIDGDDMVGIEVRGDSMKPVYREGDFLVCRRHEGRNFDNFIGLDCAVLTDDGRGFLKILRRGSRPHRYNLKSYDPHVDDVEDVQLKWVAPVTWIKRHER